MLIRPLRLTRGRRLVMSSIASLCAFTAPAWADEPAPAPKPAPTSTPEPELTPETDPALSYEPDLDNRTRILGRRPYNAASSFTVRDRDFLLRPHPRPADILMVTPGLYVVQHAGGGKANQYFLRGFDADHGTDVSIMVDGIPVNKVSHGHGQGYADLNWLIPEVVQRIEVSKGPYYAEFGDFGTAGTINIVTHRKLQANEVSLTGGMFDTWRGLVMVSPDIKDWAPLIAAEVYVTNGPFDRGEGLERYSFFSKVTHDFDDGARLSLAFTSYGAGWNASGQLPIREIRAGRLDRFGTIDASDGGNSQRHSVYGQYRVQPTDDSELTVMAWLENYRLSLYSNFTFFSADPLNGDQIEQQDNRTIFGAKAAYRFVCRWHDIAFDTTIGTQVRSDSIANGLSNSTQREVRERVVRADIAEGSLGVYAQEEITWTPWLRTILGMRMDYFGFDVTDRLEDLSTLGTKTSGVRQATQPSPKASIVISPVDDFDVFLNFGIGFHSNDARGVVRGQDAVTPLAQARGYEAGVRTRLFDSIDIAAAVYALDLDSELVWVGDAGETEARGETERVGVEAEVRAELTDWLFLDGDMTWSSATYVENAGNGNAVALAPTLIVSGGVSVQHPSGFYGRIGLFHLADRPATEDEFLTAKGFTRIDLTAGYKHERFELSLSIQNLFDADVREAQFANVSRLPNENSASDCPAGTRPAEDGGTFAGCEDLHITPGAPINIQATAKLFF